MLWSIMCDHKIIHVHGHEVGGAQQEICMHLALLSYLYYCACFEVSCTHDNITHVNGHEWVWPNSKYNICIWQGLSNTMRASKVQTLCLVSGKLTPKCAAHSRRYSSAPPSMSTWCIHVINGPRLSRPVLCYCQCKPKNGGGLGARLKI